MTSLVNFAFDENLVRVTIAEDGSPWFAAVDVCRCLDIKDASMAVSRLDGDEKGANSIGTLGGNQVMIVISEAGVYRLAFTSRKEEARRFARWVTHEVLPSIRKTGRYGTDIQDDATAFLSDTGIPLAERVHRLDLVKTALRVHGRARAIVLWQQLGLPQVPDAPSTSLDDARNCLAHLLAHCPNGGDRDVRQLVERALDDDEDARAMLLGCGIRVSAESDGFTVSNVSPGMARIFAGTAWAGFHARALRRLPGVTATLASRYGAMTSRGVFVPSSYLDRQRAIAA